MDFYSFYSIHTGISISIYHPSFWVGNPNLTHSLPGPIYFWVTKCVKYCGAQDLIHSKSYEWHICWRLELSINKLLAWLPYYTVFAYRDSVSKDGDPIRSEHYCRSALEGQLWSCGISRVVWPKLVQGLASFSWRIEWRCLTPMDNEQCDGYPVTLW